VYYRRGERASLGAPESSTDSDSIRIGTAQSGRTATPSDSNFPLSIYRPRNRPHQRMSHPDTLSISEDELEQDIYVIQPARRHNLQHHPFSPRLRNDRRSQARLSAWKAPSLDENLGSMLFSRQNRQILLFALGFIFPFGKLLPGCMHITLVSAHHTDAHTSMDDCIIPSSAPEPGNEPTPDSEPDGP
jgi:hypothetical protein